MSAADRWTVSGTSNQIFSYQGERLFYVTMVDGWEDQKVPTYARILKALRALEVADEAVTAAAAKIRAGKDGVK